MTKIRSAPIMYSLNQFFGSRYLTISFPNFSRFLHFPLPNDSNKPGRFREPVRMKKHQSFTWEQVYLECRLPLIDIAPWNCMKLDWKSSYWRNTFLLGSCVLQRVSCSLGRSILLKSNIRKKGGSSFEDQIICIFRCRYSHHVFPIQTHLTVTWNNIKKWVPGEPQQEIHQFSAGRFSDLLRNRYSEGKLWSSDWVPRVCIHWVTMPASSNWQSWWILQLKKKGHQHSGKWVSTASQRWIAGLGMVNWLTIELQWPSWTNQPLTLTVSAPNNPCQFTKETQGR